MEDPDNFYLNWAPGPMGTRMFEYMKNCILTDPTSTKEEIDMWKSMTPLECSYSGTGLTFDPCVPLDTGFNSRKSVKRQFKRRLASVKSLIP